MTKKDHILAALRANGGWMSHHDFGAVLIKHGNISDARVCINELIREGLCEVRFEPGHKLGKRQFRAKPVGLIRRIRRALAA